MIVTWDFESRAAAFSVGAKACVLMLFVLAAVALTACGGGSPGPAPAPAPGPGPAPTTYTVGGTVLGLTGTVVLQNAGGSNLSVSASGAFTFSTPLTSGAAYNIAVLNQPTGQTCAVANGSGTVGTANITSITVTCTNNAYTIGGTVSGLSAGQNVVLQNNGGGSVNVIANGGFTFTNSLLSGASYNATIVSQPTGQVCSIAGGSGTVSAANVSSVVVTCSAPIVGFTIGGAVSGLGLGKNVVLQVLTDGGGATLTATSNGVFTMPFGFANGAEYELFIVTQPIDQLCKVANEHGDIANANVSNIAVTCISKAIGAKNWGAAGVIGARTQPEFFPKIAVSANGDAMAVWESIRVIGIAHDVYYSRYTAGSGWSAPAIIPRMTPGDAFGDNSRNPNVAIDANGNAIAVWRGPASGEGFDVYASRHTVGSGWSPRERLHVKHPDFIEGPSAAEIEMDGNGNAIVVWSGAFGVQYNRYVVGVGWGDPAVHRLINTFGSTIDSEPALGVNSSGDAVAVWQERPSLMGERHLWSSRYSVATGTWGTPQVVDPINGAIPQFANNVVLDVGGNATATWTRYDGTRLHVMFNRHVSGAWGTAAPLAVNNTDPMGGAYDSRIAIDGSGHVFAMWRQIFDDSFFMASRFTPGVGWSTPVTIGDYVENRVSSGIGSRLDTTEYDIASNASGNAVAVWTLSRGLLPENVLYPPDLWSNQYVVGSGWSIPEVIDGVNVGEGSNYAAYPAVGIDGSGNALAVWEGASSESQIQDIRFNRMQ